LRQTRLKPGGPAAIVKAVREYRDRFPDKAVIYNADENCPSTHDGWATLVSGGSLADVKLPAQLAKMLPGMRPVDGLTTTTNTWSLGNEDENFVVYTAGSAPKLALRLPTAGRYIARWLEPATGKIQAEETVTAGPDLSLSPKTNVLWLSIER
jgi:hypothetical protein